jgi:hypothetical protein
MYNVTKLQGGEEDEPLLTTTPLLNSPSPAAQCLRDKIKGNQRFIRDDGYRGEPTKISTTRPGEVMR